MQIKEKELEAREMELLERELQIIINSQTPEPNKRKGKFSKKVSITVVLKNELLIGVCSC